MAGPCLKSLERTYQVQVYNVIFFFKQKTAYEIMPSLVGSEMCIRDSGWAVFKKLGTYVPGTSTSFGSVLAWMGFAVARNKEACPSHPRVLEPDRTPAFLLLLLLMLLTYCWLVLLGVFFLLPTLLRKLYEYDRCCENSHKSSGYEH